MTKLFKINKKSLIATIVLSTTLITGLPHFVFAQSNPGLTIFSGVDRKNELSYRLDFGGRSGQWDRYRLRIPGKKLTQGVDKFFVSYPEHFNGRFDLDRIEVRVRNNSLPVREIIWDEESRIIEISLEQPLLESNQVELVFSNVRNPNSGGTFYFQGQILTPGQVPLRLSVGTWILSIN